MASDMMDALMALCQEKHIDQLYLIDRLEQSLAKSYAESIGLALDSGAVYCWDNPIAAGVKCKYTERDIRGYLDRYAKDGDITDVWIWYEQTGSGSYEIYIGYA